MSSLFGGWPSTSNILRRDLLALAAATHDTPFATVDIHGLKELLLSIHTLELDVGIDTLWVGLLHILSLSS